ncbi:MAG TPA: hypothetical protein PLZ95_08025 [Bryobacteraceae bacterium]|nr:hypothetical protein [Bryobacteraceae bacterium]
MEEIPALLRSLGTTSLLDIPCGDFNWPSPAELGVEYIGADDVREQVRPNEQGYGRPYRRSLHLELTSSDLPEASVVLCRDCLVQCGFGKVARALDRIRASSADYHLPTRLPLTLENADITDGDRLARSFTLPPSNLPPPNRSIVENCTGDGEAYSDKPLALWNVALLA